MEDSRRTSAYLFTVEIDGIETARFQKCEGLEAETYVYEIEEGGFGTHKFSGRTRYPNIVLEKGINDNNELYNWYKQTLLEDRKIERKNGSIVLKDIENNEIKRWNFFRALPCRWIGPRLDARLTSEFAVERIEITHEGLEVDNDSEPFELKVDRNQRIAQAGISDIPVSNTAVFYDNYGNPSTDPNVVTGLNIGEPNSIVPLEAADNLIAAQDAAMDNPIYRQGGGGPFGNTNPDATWCNQATFEIARDAAPGLADAMYGTDPSGYNTTANMAAENLRNAADDVENSVVEITPQQAQDLSNQGYTVVAARENPTGASGHMATVRPGNEFDESTGPMLNNIGAERRTRVLRTDEAFVGNSYTNGEVHFYYDSEQF